MVIVETIEQFERYLPQWTTEYTIYVPWFVHCDRLTLKIMRLV
jgi:hypothetical protein